MKVMDLRCAHGHTFEGWFASDQEWQRQCESGLIACPLCGDGQVQRLPSAPRLNLGAKPAVSAAAVVAQDGASTPSNAAPDHHVARAMPAEASGPGAAAATQLQALWLQAVRHVMAHTQDVGERFPEEARRIHYGEEPQRPIRGQASRDEVEALLDEGIELLSLPIPAALKGPAQ